jgi:hypothetical protein
MKFSAIITAGGTSSRFGNTNKLLEQINGKEIIKYTIDAFLEAGIEDIVVCANFSDRLLRYVLAGFPVRVIEGGASRQESVYNGLQAVDCDYVLIRSCWNYHKYPDKFIQWINSLNIPTINSKSLIQWNIHKKYLLELEKHNIEIPKTYVIQKENVKDFNFNIFDENLLMYPVFDKFNTVLEVKYNGFLLTYIKDLFN